MTLKSNGKSLYSVLGAYFFIIITITLLLQASYNYMHVKNQLENNIINDVETSSLQLKGSLIPFIESYQVTEYENLIKNEMEHKNLLAIIVEDYLTGEVIGEQSYITGFIRNKDLEARALIDEKNNYNKQFKEALYKKETLLKDNNEIVGKLIIYANDYHLKKELESIIINNLISTLIIYTILFFIIYIIIKNVVIKPIDNIVKSLLNREKDEIKPSIIKEDSTKEFLYLSNSINKMTSEIKEYNEKLKESQFRWEFAVEGSGDGLWDWNVKTSEVFFSKKWKEMLGFKENEIKGSLKEWEKRVHPDDLEQVFIDINKHLNGETKIYTNEHRVKCKDGSYKWILARGVVVQRDNDGQATRIIGTHTDIEDRKEYEKLMKQALSVFENTNEGILVTDKNNVIINVNPSFCRITGYEKEEVIGQKPSILKSSIYNEDFYQNMWKKLLNDGIWQGEITNKVKDGKLVDEYLSINVIKNENGEIESYIGIFSDISILKQQEKMLLQQARTSAIGEMIGNIAHQWRQPLSAISTASTGMKLQIEMGMDISKEENLETLDKINEQTQHLSNTIEDFRGFFRNDTSEVKEFNVSLVINKVNNLIKDSLINNFIETNYDIDENIYIEGNSNLLIQALLNIFNNALDVLKNKEKDRFLFVSVKKEDNKVLIRIKDSGGGIPIQYIDKIFDPYFTTKHQSQGTGIGLYMTHQIINKQLHGTISVTNSTYEYEDNEYIGAEFIITL